MSCAQSCLSVSSSSSVLSGLGRSHVNEVEHDRQAKAVERIHFMLNTRSVLPCQQLTGMISRFFNLPIKRMPLKSFSMVLSPMTSRVYLRIRPFLELGYRVSDSIADAVYSWREQNTNSCRTMSLIGRLAYIVTRNMGDDLSMTRLSPI